MVRRTYTHAESVAAFDVHFDAYAKLVLVTRDDQFVDLIDEMHKKGVRVYLIAPEMVNHYLHFTSSQITSQHQKYSPMDRLQEDTGA